MVFAFAITGAEEDIRSWLFDLRFDILRHFQVYLKNGDVISGDFLDEEILDSIGMLGSDMINPRTGDNYIRKCPF